MKYNDIKISEEITYHLVHDIGEDSKDINLEIQDGYVHLSGIVDVMKDKIDAEKIVLDTRGVKGVENNITISMDGSLPDSKVEKIVNKKLRNSLHYNDFQGIKAKVQGGTAILEGEADTQSLRKKAMEEASKAPGIKDVVNNISLNTKNDDISLQNEVNRLFITSYIDIQDVRPDITDGVVALYGYVNNDQEAKTLVSIAEEIPGVKKVISHLKNRTWSLD